MAVLQDEVRKYPDDAESWYLLGEDYQRLGTQALVGREDADRAFGKAIELDPSFAPAYIHLIENAFAAGDSARAGRLSEKSRQLAPEIVTALPAPLPSPSPWAIPPGGRGLGGTRAPPSRAVF